MSFSPPPPHPDAGAFESRHDPSLDQATTHQQTSSSVHQMQNHQTTQHASADSRPQTSYSDTGFTRSHPSASADNTPDAHYKSDDPSGQRHRYDSQQAQHISRPSSALRGGDPPGAQYADQQTQRQQAQKNSSVVIKVGMVGDAQIGKTSLMVKYVEGSWDEDYIQTLGEHIPLIRDISH